MAKSVETETLVNPSILNRISYAASHVTNRISFKVTSWLALPPGVLALLTAATTERGLQSTSSTLITLGVGGAAAALVGWNYLSDNTEEEAMVALDKLAEGVNASRPYTLSFDYGREQTATLGKIEVLQQGTNQINATVKIDNFARNQEELCTRLNPVLLADLVNILTEIEESHGSTVLVAGAPLYVLNGLAKEQLAVQAKPAESPQTQPTMSKPKESSAFQTGKPQTKRHSRDIDITRAPGDKVANSQLAGGPRATR